MKFFIPFVALLAMACTPASEKPKPALANPASTHCIEVGGTLKIVNEADGQVGYCHLPSGEIIDEWALFKRDSKKPKE
ncbi:MAG: hemolysin [Sneathiella sp.]|nr:MAG: hemolysin [Sneathiella sp.]